MAYRRVLVGTDGSETASEAVRHAAALAAATAAELVVVSAHEGADGAGGAQALAGARAIAAGSGVDEVRARSERGDPADVILRTAEELLCDLVVVGSKGMAGAGRLLGSIARTLSHRAPCDVLIVPTT